MSVTKRPSTIFFFFFSYFWRSPFSNSCFLFSVSVDHIFLFVVVVDYLFTFCHVYYSNPRWPFFFYLFNSLFLSFVFFLAVVVAGQMRRGVVQPTQESSDSHCQSVA